jgi:hypothetical protein
MNKLILKPKNNNRLIQNELNSLMKLSNKHDYLSHYNKCLRYLSLIILKEGSNIDNTTIHKLFYNYLVYSLDINEIKAKSIKHHRHSIKYRSVKNDSELERLLIIIVQKLEFNYKTTYKSN